MASCNESIDEGHMDLFGLIGYDVYNQKAIRANIEDFFNRMAIVDMIQLGKIEALAYM